MCCMSVEGKYIYSILFYSTYMLCVVISWPSATTSQHQCHWDDKGWPSEEPHTCEKNAFGVLRHSFVICHWNCWDWFFPRYAAALVLNILFYIVWKAKSDISWKTVVANLHFWNLGWEFPQFKQMLWKIKITTYCNLFGIPMMLILLSTSLIICKSKCSNAVEVAEGLVGWEAKSIYKECYWGL